MNVWSRCVESAVIQQWVNLLSTIYNNWFMCWFGDCKIDEWLVREARVMTTWEKRRNKQACHQGVSSFCLCRFSSGCPNSFSCRLFQMKACIIILFYPKCLLGLGIYFSLFRLSNTIISGNVTHSSSAPPDITTSLSCLQFHHSTIKWKSHFSVSPVSLISSGLPSTWVVGKPQYGRRQRRSVTSWC